jgi:DNA-binding MarR family transcriptional regulator
MVGLGRVLRQVRALERQGLDFGALVVLFTIAHDEGGRRASDVAEQLHLDLSTVSRHVSTLERAGHIQRTPDPDDGRASLLTVSAAGAQALQTIMAARGEVFAAALAGWPAPEQVLLAELLDRLAGDLALVLAPAALRTPRAEAAR